MTRCNSRSNPFTSARSLIAYPQIMTRFISGPSPCIQNQPLLLLHHSNFNHHKQLGLALIRHPAALYLQRLLQCPYKHSSTATPSPRVSIAHDAKQCAVSLNGGEPFSYSAKLAKSQKYLAPSKHETHFPGSHDSPNTYKRAYRGALIRSNSGNA